MTHATQESELRAFAARVVDELNASRDMSVEKTARSLGVTVRTLQRRLADEGTDYSTIADEVRRLRALVLVAEGVLGLIAISAELGFSDRRALRRAFRRWTGLSPEEYRRQPRPDLGALGVVIDSNATRGGDCGVMGGS